MRFLWATLALLPSVLVVVAVRIYQLTLSRCLPPLCRFHPSCSSYMIGAVAKHGFLLGVWRGVGRVCRCHPWNPGGYDPP